MGWDAALENLRYEDGTPVEIARAENPYWDYLERTNASERPVSGAEGGYSVTADKTGDDA